MKIAIDVDDVLAAFTPHSYTYLNIPLTGRIDYWSVPEMDRVLGKGWFSDKVSKDINFWKTLPILSKPEDIDFEITCYMTSFPIDMFALRYNWLREHGFPDAPLIIESKKVKRCVKMGIDVLIDDKPLTIFDTFTTPVKGVHFMTPYAGFAPVGDYVITNLNQVKTVLSNIKHLV